MIFTDAHQKQRCVLSSCGHAPAVKIGHHEFANYADKPVCQDHYERLIKLYTPKKKTRSTRS